jgi:hypothetical protein
LSVFFGSLFFFLGLPIFLIVLIIIYSQYF